MEKTMKLEDVIVIGVLTVGATFCAGLVFGKTVSETENKKTLEILNQERVLSETRKTENASLTEKIDLLNNTIHTLETSLNQRISATNMSNKSNENKLLQLSENNEIYKSILTQLNATWRHQNKPKPTLLHIFQVVNSPQVLQAHNNYLDTIIKTKPTLSTPFAAEGNVLRRWHGPGGLKCKELMNGVICQDTACVLCNILRHGLQIEYIGTRKPQKAVATTKWNRFGKGLYFTATSSKADDYAEGVEENLGKGIRCLLLSNVVMGRALQVTDDNEGLCQEVLDKGKYHSVYVPGKLDGDVKKSCLNYGEVIVYKNEASLVKYLVIYKCKK